MLNIQRKRQLISRYIFIIAFYSADTFFLLSAKSSDFSKTTFVVIKKPSNQREKMFWFFSLSGIQPGTQMQNNINLEPFFNILYYLQAVFLFIVVSYLLLNGWKWQNNEMLTFQVYTVHITHSFITQTNIYFSK